jgi:hypothetical protein
MIDPNAIVAVLLTIGLAEPPVATAPPPAAEDAPVTDVATASEDPVEPSPAPTDAEPTATSAPPAAEPATQPAASPQAPPPRVVVTPDSAPPRDAPPARRSSEGTGLIISGAVLTGLGAGSLLLIAAPAAVVKSIALARAEGDPLVAVDSRRSRYRRARIADDVMEGGFWTGVSMLGIGIPLLVTGVVLRNRARSEVASRLHVDPGGLTVRF